MSSVQNLKSYASLQMWSLEHIQVPVERKLKRCEEVTSRESELLGESYCKKLDLFKKMDSMSLNEDNGEYNLTIYFSVRI